MMKVVFFRHSLLSRGGDKMILAHAGYMAGQGWTVEIRTSQVDTIFPIPEGARIVDLGSKSKTATLWQALKSRFDTDFVVVDIIPLACLLSLRNRGRLIYFAQDYDESYFTHVWQRLFIRFLYFIGLSFLKIRTIAVADHLTELFRRRFRADVITVNNGVDSLVFFPETDTRLMEGKAGRKSVILLSRTDFRKGFDLCYKIIQRMRQLIEPDQVEIWTVGDPVESGFPGFIHRDLGYVGAERLRQILSSADAFLYHTRHEGFPLMALEALACGCPMAASSAVSVVDPCREALIAPVGNLDQAAGQLARILTDDALAGSLRKNGLAFARNHSLGMASKTFARVLLGQEATEV